MDWIMWLFSGIGVVLIGGLVKWLIEHFQENEKEAEQEATLIRLWKHVNIEQKNQCVFEQEQPKAQLTEQHEKDRQQEQLKELDKLAFDENGNNIFNKNYHKFQRLDLNLFWEWTKKHPNVIFKIKIDGNPVEVRNGERINHRL